MTRINAWRQVCVLGALLGALACDDERGGTKPEPDAGGGMDAGQVALGSVQGLVTNTKGEGIADVTVNVGGKTATTDKDGLFDVADLPEGDVQVAVEDKALSAAQTSVSVKSEQKATVALTADESVVVAIDNLEKGGTIEKDGVTVVLPENSLQTNDGAVAKGPGEMRFVVVAEPEKAKAAPGGMKGEAGAETVQLAPDGMIDIRFYKGLERLVFVGEADLTFPLGPNKKMNGDEVTVWSFDENSGKWKEEGKGTVDRVEPETSNGSVKTKAKHFTWWASAEPLADGTCLNGTLANQDTPVAGAVVEAISPDSLLYVQATSGDDGSFCLPVPQESAVQVTAFGSAAEALLTWSWHLGTASEPAMCGGACSELPAQEPRPFEPGGGERDASVPIVDAMVPHDSGVDMDATVIIPDAGHDSSVPVAEICTNGVDDNQNQLTDCQDPSCGALGISCTRLGFNGDGSYVSTSRSGDGGTSYVAETLASEGTVEFWFRAWDVDVELGAGLVDMTMCGDNYIGLVGASGDGGVPAARVTSVLRQCDGDGSSIVTGTTLIEFGRWYHVARTWSATEHTLYIDATGADIGLHDGTALDSSGLNPEFGHRHYFGTDNGRYLYGDMDEIRIWNYVRSLQEVASTMHEVLAAPQSGIIGYWRLNEGTGTTTADVSGFMHDGTLHSANWFTAGSTRILRK